MSLGGHPGPPGGVCPLKHNQHLEDHGGCRLRQPTETGSHICQKRLQHARCALINIVSYPTRERCKKKGEKKLTNVSFMYVCVAENGEMLVFFSFFFPTIV